MAKRKKKLLPVTTPEADILRSLLRRMEKDVEIMGKMAQSTKEKKKYPLEELVQGVEWLTWLENEKRNEERRLAKEEDHEREHLREDVVGDPEESDSEEEDRRAGV